MRPNVVLACGTNILLLRSHEKQLFILQFHGSESQLSADDFLLCFQRELMSAYSFFTDRLWRVSLRKFVPASSQCASRGCYWGFEGFHPFSC